MPKDPKKSNEKVSSERSATNEATKDSPEKLARKLATKKRGETIDSTTIFLLVSNIFLACIIAYILTGVNKERNKLSKVKPYKRMADCEDYYKAGYYKNGAYEIQPSNDPASKFSAYCDMDLGGWTMIMRRDANDQRTIFNRPFENYKSGFGDLMNNHWLGLERINLLTEDKERDMLFFIDNVGYKVHGFKVDDEFHHFKLTIKSEIDRMPNECSLMRLNNTRFSAKNVDFDYAPVGVCSETLEAGWWYTNCYDLTVAMTALHAHDRSGIIKFRRGVMLIK